MSGNKGQLRNCDAPLFVFCGGIKNEAFTVYKICSTHSFLPLLDPDSSCWRLTGNLKATRMWFVQVRFQTDLNKPNPGPEQTTSRGDAGSNFVCLAPSLSIVCIFETFTLPGLLSVKNLLRFWMATTAGRSQFGGGRVSGRMSELCCLSKSALNCTRFKSLLPEMVSIQLSFQMELNIWLEPILVMWVRCDHVVKTRMFSPQSKFRGVQNCCLWLFFCPALTAEWRGKNITQQLC